MAKKKTDAEKTEALKGPDAVVPETEPKKTVQSKKAEKPKPADEPEPMEAVEGVTLEAIAKVLRRSAMVPRHFDLHAIQEDVNLRGLTILEAAAQHMTTRRKYS